MNQFGFFLKNKRINIGFTQKAIAQQLQCERSTYSKYELGTVVPKVETLLKLSVILNTPCINFMQELSSDLEIDAPLV